MKKHLLFVFAALMSILTSCEKTFITVDNNKGEREEIISYKFQIDRNYMKIGKEAGSFTIRVKSNHEWNATIQKPQNHGIPKIELDKCCGTGDAIITVNYSKPHRNFYYGYEETSSIVFHHKNGTNKAPRSSQTICTVKRTPN